MVIPTSGYYKLGAGQATTGTTTAADSDNVQLVIPGDANQVIVGVQGTPALSATLQEFYAYIPAGTTIQLQAIANGNAAGVYHVKLTATLWPRVDDAVGRTS